MTTREAVVAEALTWIGTPFHDMTGVKGAGTDCVHLILRVYASVGLMPNSNPQYAPQWFLHRDEPLFLNGLAEHAHRIDESSALPGDVLMYNFGRHAAHGAIVLDETSIIHAYKPIGKVSCGDRREFAHRLHSAWSVFQ